MRPNIWTRTLVSAGAVVGLAAGGLATAGTAFAGQDAKPAVSSEASVLAVNNLGLNTARAKNWQCWLHDMGYNPGTVDGQLGGRSWKAAQAMFNDLGLGAGTEDGIVGTRTIRALQRYLNDWGFDAGPEDGIAGTRTKKAFWDFNATGC